MNKLRLVQSCNDIKENICIKEILYLSSRYRQIKKKYPLSYYYLFHNICYSKTERLIRINKFLKNVKKKTIN